MRLHCVMLFTAVASLAACGESATLEVADGTGPNPELPPPNKTAIPTINIATAKGWPPEDRPAAAPGTAVARFAEGLDHPRWLYVLPDGEAYGRPVGVAIDRQGALLVADDVGNIIWRVTASSHAP